MHELEGSLKKISGRRDDDKEESLYEEREVKTWQKHIAKKNLIKINGSIAICYLLWKMRFESWILEKHDFVLVGATCKTVTSCESVTFCRKKSNTDRQPYNKYIMDTSFAALRNVPIYQ